MSDQDPSDTADLVEFEAELFAWTGASSWYFVRLPLAAAEDLRDLALGPPGGFGSIRVAVRVGASSWSTSVFPDKGSGSFLLPVKKAVRRAEDLEDGDRLAVSLRPLAEGL